jgi:hypothetical protein
MEDWRTGGLEDWRIGGFLDRGFLGWLLLVGGKVPRRCTCDVLDVLGVVGVGKKWRYMQAGVVPARSR